MANNNLKDINALAALGRFGDTEISEIDGGMAHTTPHESEIIDSLGALGEMHVKKHGAGTINPETGLPEYHLWHKHGIHNKAMAQLTAVAAGVGAAMLLGPAATALAGYGIGTGTVGTGAMLMAGGAAYGATASHKRVDAFGTHAALAESKGRSKQALGEGIDRLMAHTETELGIPGQSKGKMLERFEKEATGMKSAKSTELSALKAIEQERVSKSGLAYSGGLEKKFDVEESKLMQALKLDAEAEQDVYLTERQAKIDQAKAAIEGVKLSYEQMYGEEYGKYSEAGVDIEEWLSQYEEDV